MWTSIFPSVTQTAALLELDQSATTWGLSRSSWTVDQIPPDQINTAGLTHLLYGYASWWPNNLSFAFEYIDDETGWYDDSVAHKSGSLQTWVSIRGPRTQNQPSSLPNWFVYLSNVTASAYAC